GEADSDSLRPGPGGCAVAQLQQRADLLGRVAPAVFAQGRHRKDLRVGAGAGRGPAGESACITEYPDRVKVVGTMNAPGNLKSIPWSEAVAAIDEPHRAGETRSSHA